MSLRSKKIRRLRYYAQRSKCMRCGGDNAIPCYLPEPPRNYLVRGQWVERRPDEVLCPEHAFRAGYCRSCGDFWGGIDSFDFIHPGLCDHCHDQLQADCPDPDDEEDYFEPYDVP